MSYFSLSFLRPTIAADISNPAKEWKICKQWTTWVMDEFFLQVRLCVFFTLRVLASLCQKARSFNGLKGSDGITLSVFLFILIPRSATYLLSILFNLQALQLHAAGLNSS